MSPEELHILRRRRRLTQAQFAERVGMSKDFVKSLETGRRQLSEHWEQEIKQALVHFGVQT
jgi:DNA-binding transcriptional regulator YiaG